MHAMLDRRQHWLCDDVQLANVQCSGVLRQGLWLGWQYVPTIHRRHACQVRIDQHVRDDRLHVLHELDNWHRRCLYRYELQEGMSSRSGVDAVR